jgi:hypothetical protein
MNMLNSILGVLLALLCVGSSPNAPPRIYRFGDARLVRRLVPDDLTAIAEAARVRGGVPWALFVRYSQVLPEVWYADAFLRPRVTTANMRRGRVLHLQCSPAEGQPGCLEWIPSARRKAGTNVQVADGKDFGRPLTFRSIHERPIDVDGEISDNDLVSLVTYLRTGPAPTTKTLGLGRNQPIMSIRLQKDATVVVNLSRDGGSGQLATVVRVDGTWKLVNVSYWVA